MRKINILSQNVYNRIAAGEVVDRPYSAVKELIENSLDANADRIEIYIEKGGKQLIKIVDNGSGIDRDDIQAAFKPHATSKLKSVEDLDNILTLGFRGEALASISAVSKVELISATDGNGAYKAVCDGGKIGEVMPAALDKGTEITVYNLFYNTPVRAKFLKTDKNEETDITNFVSRYILGYPSVSFKYFVDGKLKLQSFGGGLEEAVAQVYGSKTLSECFRISAERNGVKINGFIGNQNFFKSNKTYQSLYLNGRYIVNNTVATAVSNAYASYAMKRQYPFYVLFIDVPADMVDVNVHPNKADVRFTDSRLVFGAVYSTISAVLDGKASAADFVINADKVPEIKSTMDEHGVNKVYNLADFNKMGAVTEQIESEIAVASAQASECDLQAPTVTEAENKANEEKYIPYKQYAHTYSEQSAEPQKRVVKPAINTRQIEQDETRRYFDAVSSINMSAYFADKEPSSMAVTDDYMPPDPFNSAAYEVDGAQFATLQQKINYDTYKYRGNLFNTYLIFEYRDDVYLIDQHAAHERLIFDKLMDDMAKRVVVVQPLLLPFIFETNPQESSFLRERLDVLRSLGFGMLAVGENEFRVDTVPGDLTDINLKNFIDDVLSDMDDLGQIKLGDMLRDKLATKACKHAIKGGMELTQEEIKALFDKIDGNLGLKCPHGRPVCVKLTKRQIEKMFKRIV